MRSFAMGILLLSSATMVSASNIQVDPQELERWKEGFEIPKTGRDNPYNFSDEDLPEVITEGRRISVIYPFSKSGLLFPYESFTKIIEGEGGIIQSIASKAFHLISPFDTMDEFYDWAGLMPYPDPQDSGVYSVPDINGITYPDYGMGFSIIDNEETGAQGIGLGCVSCHGGRLFGKSVIGLTNRFPRTFDLANLGKTLAQSVPASLYKLITNASPGEMELYRRLKYNLQFVEAKKPQTFGLDTSVASTLLSYTHRAFDGEATRDPQYIKNPHHSDLRTKIADSKPPVFWNVKYKNKWLSDGSAVGANPIIMNIIISELGRGGSIQELDEWFDNNKDKIEALTTAVFKAEAPKFTDFFPAEKIDLESAKRGQDLFNVYCTECHGRYKKAWETPEAKFLSHAELLETVEVKYFKDTPIKNVGTSEHRWKNFKSVLAFNNLNILKKHGGKYVYRDGYVPPPLVGIWARWPYLHNNSVPDLCSMLLPSGQRPKTFWQGQPVDTERDFDSECNGYPKGADVPSDWKKNRELLYNTNKEGLSNKGHDEGIFIIDGEYLFDAQDRRDLVQFLQTL